MSKHILILLVLISSVRQIFGQYDSNISLFSLNQTYFNPGATGNLDVLGATFFHRQEMGEFDGAPSTQVFSVHAPLKNPAVALGVLLEHEAIGSRSLTGFHFSYAYRITMGSNRLSLGLRAGIKNSSESLKPRDEEYDPLLDPDNNQYTIPNFGFGILFNGSNYWASLSLPKMMGFKVNTGKYQMDPDISNHEYHMAAGGNFILSPDFTVEPSFLVIYSQTYPALVNYHLNAMGSYKESYKAGLGYRNNGSLILLIGYKINQQFSIGYSYDLGIGQDATYLSGAHEINIQYKFGYKINASNPRGF